MKKKIFKWLICSIVILIILLLGIYCFRRISEKKAIEETVQTFHDFCAFSVKNNHEFCTELLPDRPIMILFMHPECDFCQEEIKQLKEMQSKIEDVSILLISSAPKKQIADFYSNQNLSQFDNLQFLVDEDFKISNGFDVHIIPSAFLYGTDKKLIFKHNGEIKIQTLINYLTRDN